MVFSSPAFLALFFPALLGIYLVAPKGCRNSVLLVASLFFYAWGEPRALPVLFIVIIFNYLIAFRLEQGAKKRFYIWVAIWGNLGCLTFFKYADFLIANLNFLLKLFALRELPLPQILLPIGISFFIFQALSYVIDVYRGNAKALRDFWDFALYLALFPQLLAGPIVRYLDIARDLRNRQLNKDNFYEGLTRFCLGLAKKIFLADNLGLIADNIFAAPPDSIPCAWAWLGATAYALQLYYDFSAYSDMAIGIGRMFNFHFPENFNHPYAASSLRDFWRRWHMSLTAWLRDYLYIPLGGSRCSSLCAARNILLTLALCGLWHGAAWSFLLWGLYHGLGLAGERALRKHFSTLWPDNILFAFLARSLTLLFVLVGWVIFRSPDHSYAFSYLAIMFCGNANHDALSFNPDWLLLLTFSNLFFLLSALLLTQPIARFRLQALQQSRLGQLWLLILFGASYAVAMTNSYSPFLYFRF